MVYLTLLALLSGAGYLFSKLYDIWYVNENQQRFSASKNSLTFFSNLQFILVVATLLMIVATATAAILNMQKFGQGLMEKLDQSKSHDADQELNTRRHY